MVYMPILRVIISYKKANVCLHDFKSQFLQLEINDIRFKMKGILTVCELGDVTF